MIKVTPDPPVSENISPYKSDRASQFDKPRLSDAPPVNIFAVVPGLNSETLLANAYETLAGANVLVSDLAFDVEGSCRSVALAIQQMIELSQLLVNEALEQGAPAG
jgi:hypothetical protein